MTQQLSLLWVIRLTSLSLCVQTVELLLLKPLYSNSGIWSWSKVAPEFEFLPALPRKLLDFILRYPQFDVMLWVRLLSAAGVSFYPHPLILTFLFLSTLLISVRWRGTFNGGSDFMTLSVLFALSVAQCFADIPVITRGCLWYIGIQACTSYFLAGVVKVKHTSWRQGYAIPAFIDSSIYGPLPALSRFYHSRTVGLGMSWFILAFECLFPLALWSPSSCAFFMATALVFHVGNFYVFGLNRFVFAWAATYPALYYCSQHMSA